MAGLKLRPDHLAVLKAISEYGPIKVPELVEKVDYDRGTVEAAIGSLEKESLVKRDVKVKKQYILTERGKESKDGLAERKIIRAIDDGPVHMKELAEIAELSNDDMTAGIGILRKANIISINQGKVNLVDDDRAENFSLELEKVLNKLDEDGSDIDEEVAQKLLDRGFIEELERTEITVSTPLSKEKISNAEVVQEITKLTPKMISDGSWKNVTFKPYSLETKPKKIYGGRYQPYREFLEHLKAKLIGLGFEEMKGPLIEQEFWNFDALFAPQDHASREDSDILLVENPTYGELLEEDFVSNVAKTHENGWKTGSRGHRYKWDPKKAARLLLRPQGTAISARTLNKVEPPAKYFSIAKCYRPDQIDATHAIEFNQTEGIICNPDITFRDLLGVLKTFAVEVAGADEVRFRPDYYPFTSPSVELSAKHPKLGYIEFGGAGIFRPEVTRPFGIDYPVLAWGLGVERLFMTKYNISDIRELYSQNLEWLRTEKVSSSIEVGDN